MAPISVNRLFCPSHLFPCGCHVAWHMRPLATRLSGTDRAAEPRLGTSDCPSSCVHLPPLPGSHCRHRPGLRGPKKSFRGPMRSQWGLCCSQRHRALGPAPPPLRTRLLPLPRASRPSRPHQSGCPPTSVTRESPASHVPVNSWRFLRLTPAPFSCNEKGGQGPLPAGTPELTCGHRPRPPAGKFTVG